MPTLLLPTPFDDDIVGTPHPDAIALLEGNDRFAGGDGNDTALGGAGDDTLQGGMANDLLDGGDDNDLLQGGAGYDTFVFATGYGSDTITDFEDGIDVIDISGLGPVAQAFFGDPLFEVRIDAGESFVLVLDADRLAIENNSGEAIYLTADDFI